METHTCDPSTEEVEAGGSEVHCKICEFKASLVYLRPVLEKQNNTDKDTHRYIPKSISHNLRSFHLDRNVISPLSPSCFQSYLKCQMHNNYK